MERSCAPAFRSLDRCSHRVPPKLCRLASLAAARLGARPYSSYHFSDPRSVWPGWPLQSTEGEERVAWTDRLRVDLYWDGVIRSYPQHRSPCPPSSCLICNRTKVARSSRATLRRTAERILATDRRH